MAGLFLEPERIAQQVRIGDQQHMDVRAVAQAFALLPAVRREGTRRRPLDLGGQHVAFPGRDQGRVELLRRGLAEAFQRQRHAVRRAVQQRNEARRGSAERFEQADAGEVEAFQAGGQHVVVGERVAGEV